SVSRRAGTAFWLKFLDEDQRAAAALLVTLAAVGGEVVRGPLPEAALLHEIIERLGGQAKDLRRPGAAGEVLGVVHEFSAYTLVLVLGVDADAGQLDFLLARVVVGRRAGDRVAVHLEHEKIVDLPLDVRRGAAQ